MCVCVCVSSCWHDSMNQMDNGNNDCLDRPIDRPNGKCKMKISKFLSREPRPQGPSTSRPNAMNSMCLFWSLVCKPVQKIRESYVAPAPSERPLNPSKWPGSRRLFLLLFKSLSGRHMFLSRCHVPVTILLVLKLFPRSRVCEAVINTPI